MGGYSTTSVNGKPSPGNQGKTHVHPFQLGFWALRAGHSRCAARRQAKISGFQIYFPHFQPSKWLDRFPRCAAIDFLRSAIGSWDDPRDSPGSLTFEYRRSKRNGGAPRAMECTKMRD